MLEVGFDEFAGCTVAGSLAVVRIEVEDGKVIELDDMFCQFLVVRDFKLSHGTTIKNRPNRMLVEE